jgi:citrate lyase subunit beta / citryl-CoA lyase
MAMAKTGIAGNHGDRVRSDCRIKLEIKSSGGINLTINSRVEALYGKSIRELVFKILKHYTINNAKILIDDTGALDFVIAARLEAAIKQLQDTNVEFLLPSGHVPQTPGDPNRFRLTRLYLPGNTPALMINAGIHKPDGIILDLEDSVVHDRKEEARILVRNSLRSVDFFAAERIVRINPFPAGIIDLDYIIPQGPDLILVPKVEHTDQIKAVENRINDICSNTGLSQQVFLMPILESALGIENAFDIACSSENIVAMTIGLEDYTADLGVARTEEGTESLYARSRLVNACRAAGVQAIDSVYSDVDNEQGLNETVQRSRAMGFEGMGCIHPRQISVISKAYQPTSDQIVKARQIILAFEQAEKDGLGVVSLGSKMIDPPVVKRAENTIELALKMGLLTKNWRKENE